MVKVYLNNEIIEQLLISKTMVNTRVLSKMEQLKSKVIFVYSSAHLEQYLCEHGEAKVSKWSERLHQFTKGHFLSDTQTAIFNRAKQPARLKSLPPLTKPAKGTVFQLATQQPELQQILNQYLPKVLANPQLENLLEEWKAYMDENKQGTGVIAVDVPFAFEALELKEKGSTLNALVELLPKTAHEPKLSHLLEDLVVCLAEGKVVRNSSVTKENVDHDAFAELCDFWVLPHRSKNIAGQTKVKTLGIEDFIRKIDDWTALPQDQEAFLDKVIRLCSHPLVFEATTPEGVAALGLPLDTPFLNFFQEGYFLEKTLNELLFVRDYEKKPIFKEEPEQMLATLSAILGTYKSLTDQFCWTLGHASITFRHDSKSAMLQIEL